MLPRKVATALSILTNQGVEQVARVSLEKAGMWWRHGEALEVGKFLGRPSDVARLDGCRFRLDSPVVSESLRYLLLSGKHEAPERTLVRRWLDPGLPVVECGGSIGVVSCITNALLADRTRHVVVEANPALVPLLLANRDLNGAQFTVLNRAVAHGAPVMQFHVAANVLSSSLQFASEQSVAVPTTTLEEVLRDRQFERCSLICDIEGAEVELVEREAHTLSARVATIVMELHDRRIGPAQSSRIRVMLDEAGFDVVDRVWETVAFRNRRF